MRFNNLRRLHFCVALIMVSMFLFLPTMLVSGAESTNSVTLDKDGEQTVDGATGDSLEASSVEYDSANWTGFTIDILNANASSRWRRQGF